jgi:hypothetical protein
MLTFVSAEMSAAEDAMLRGFYAAMTTDPLRRYYWHDAMPTSYEAFVTGLRTEALGIMAHHEGQPQAFTMVQRDGVHPGTGHSLHGQLSLYVMPAERHQASALLRECLAPLILKGWTQFFAVVHPWHMACRMMTRAIGFTYHTTYRQYLTFDGKPQDMRVYVYTPGGA